jgi:hypothetical protein
MPASVSWRLHSTDWYRPLKCPAAVPRRAPALTRPPVAMQPAGQWGTGALGISRHGRGSRLDASLVVALLALPIVHADTHVVGYYSRHGIWQWPSMNINGREWRRRALAAGRGRCQ